MRAVPVRPIAGVAAKKVDPGALLGSTNDSGEFQMTSYKGNDGLPAGDYSLTFIELGIDGKDDALNRRYNTPDKSPKTITVEPAKPLEVGLIELTTQ